MNKKNKIKSNHKSKSNVYESFQNQEIKLPIVNNLRCDSPHKPPNEINFNTQNIKKNKYPHEILYKYNNYKINPSTI